MQSTTANKYCQRIYGAARMIELIKLDCGSSRLLKDPSHPNAKGMTKFWSQTRLEVEDCSDEQRILMREAVVLLPSPGACVDIVDGTVVSPPLYLPGYLDEFGILNHHCVDNA